MGVVVKNRECFVCVCVCVCVYYYTTPYLVVVVAAFDVHYHSADAENMVCGATGVYAPKCHQNGIV